MIVAFLEYMNFNTSRNYFTSLHYCAARALFTEDKRCPFYSWHQKCGVRKNERLAWNVCGIFMDPLILGPERAERAENRRGQVVLCAVHNLPKSMEGVGGQMPPFQPGSAGPTGQTGPSMRLSVLAWCPDPMPDRAWKGHLKHYGLSFVKKAIEMNKNSKKPSLSI
jgi:hypothetical protein